MVLLVKLFSIAVIIYGCLLILRPDTLKKIFECVREGNNVYIAGGIKAVIGVILMLAASSCRVPWVVMFFGALSVFSGVVGFAMKKSFIIGIIDWVEKQPARFTYYVGILALLIGVLIILAA